MISAIETNDSYFRKDVLESPIPVLVDFWAEWCGPCRMIAPVIDELAKQNAGRLKVVKVNADECPDTSAQYQVRGIPTLLFFKDGQVVNQIVGAASKSRIEGEIAGLLS
jgi:thioredoxin 1